MNNIKNTIFLIKYNLAIFRVFSRVCFKNLKSSFPIGKLAIYIHVQKFTGTNSNEAMKEYKQIVTDLEEFLHKKHNCH